MGNTSSAFNEVVDYRFIIFERWERKAVTHVKKTNSMNIIPFYVHFTQLLEPKKEIIF